MGTVRAVRLDRAVRTRLEELAEESERSVSYLIRKAVQAYLDTPGIPASVPMPENTDMRHGTLRVPPALDAAINQRAADDEVTWSDVVRTAISWWIAVGRNGTGGSR